MTTWHYVVLFWLAGCILDYLTKSIWAKIKEDKDKYVKTVRIAFILFLWPIIMSLFILAAIYGILTREKPRP